MNYDDWKLMTPPEHKVCPFCDDGLTDESNCCGASFDSDTMICHECRDHCDAEECSECDGTGTI